MSRDTVGPAIGDPSLKNNREKKRARERERFNRWTAERKCWGCGGPCGDDGTKHLCHPCAKKQNARARERYRRQINEGKCWGCGDPRGDGTGTMCRPCADKENAKHTELYRHRVDEGVCAACGGRLGDDGTKILCGPCSAAQKKRDQEWRIRQFALGVCPDDKAKLSTLERCPTCVYEMTDAPKRGLSFEGLLPRPGIGNKLENCVRCESCGRVYHKGSNYDAPRRRRDVQPKDLHVGEEGDGLWLRLGDVDEEGSILVEYEGCSMPEKLCTGRISSHTADIYLSAQRTGKRVPSMCFKHVHDRAYLREVERARLLQQLSVQAQDGSGHGNSHSKQGRPPIDTPARIRKAVYAVAVEWERLKDNGRPYNRQLAQVTQLDLAPHLGIDTEGDYDVVNKRTSHWFKGCRLKVLFPGVSRPFDSFVKAVCDQLKLGESKETITESLVARLALASSEP
jgi:hypothetical protein